MKVLSFVAACLIPPSFALAQQATPPDWSGFYGGASLGHGDFSTSPSFEGSAFGPPFDVNGTMFNLFVGYNGQWNRVVAGVEGNLLFGNPSGNSTTGFFNPFEHKNSQMLSGHVGYIIGNSLAYLKLGVMRSEFASSSRSGNGSPPPLDAPIATVDFNGVIWGAGVEWRLQEGWRARLEALKLEYDNSSVTYQNYFTSPTSFETELDGVLISFGFVKEF